MELLAYLFHQPVPYSFTRMTVRERGDGPLDITRLIERVGATLVGAGRPSDRNKNLLVYTRDDTRAQAPQFIAGGQVGLPTARVNPDRPGGDAQLVTTRAATIADRRLWAMENVYVLGGQLRRTRWHVHVGIEQIDETSCILATRRSYTHGFDADVFNLTPDPGCEVWDFLRSPGYRFSIGKETLDGLPQFIGTDISVQRFVEHLSDAQRNTAILVGYDTDIDTTRLVRALVGHATIFVPATEVVEDAISKILDIDLAAGDEEITISHPGQLPGLRVKPVKQRNLAFRELDREVYASINPGATYPDDRSASFGTGPREALAAIISNVFHFGIRADETTVVAPSDVDDRVRRDALDHLRASHTDGTELLRLFEEENDVLTGRLSRRERELRVAETARKELTAERDALRHEVLGLKARVGAITSSRPLIDAPDVRTLPKNLLDAVDLACRIYQHKLFATEAARVSAEAASDADLERAWRCLYDMANVLHPLHFKEGLPLRTIAKRFQEETGFELAVHESESTRSNDRLAAMRAQTYNGEVLDISTHIKIGNKRGKALRVHYAPHVIDQRIIIGHFGAHLPTGKDR
jgi:hypothetical protein